MFKSLIVDLRSVHMCKGLHLTRVECARVCRFLVIYGVAPTGSQSEVEQFASQVSQGYR